MAFLDEIEALSLAGQAEVRAAVAHAAETIGARFYSHLRPFDSVPGAIPPVMTNFPERWTTNYMEHKQYRADPVVRRSVAANTLLWFSADEPESDPESAKIMAERYSSGCRTGVALPVRGRNGQFSILSFWHDQPKTFRQAVADHFCQLHTLALYVHDAAFRLRDQPRDHGLTDVELECMKWTALGKTAWEISVLLGLPERTVHYHLAEASRKLGAPNKTAAVCTALRAGLLDY